LCFTDSTIYAGGYFESIAKVNNNPLYGIPALNIVQVTCIYHTTVMDACCVTQVQHLREEHVSCNMHVTVHVCYSEGGMHVLYIKCPWSKSSNAMYVPIYSTCMLYVESHNEKCHLIIFIAQVLKVCRTHGPIACSRTKMLQLAKVCLKS